MIHPKRHDPWYRKSALYQIYPLSWADSNGDGYGDLKGITAHLDYLNDGTADSLGVGAIWLSPIYRSGMVDWGYDVIDHCDIDPIFGTLADFDELLAQAHRRGMKVLLDFVPNHTSIKHPWFEEARRSRTSSKRDWFIWAEPKGDGTPPNNWLSRFGGSAWTLDTQTGQYYLHSFLPEQPDLNWRNPEVRDAMLDILRFWLNRGVDGFRADAITALMKDRGLRDDPPNPDYRPGIDDPSEANLRVYSGMSLKLDAVLGAFCNVLAEHDDTYLLSEAYVNIPGLQELYGACREHPIHAPFNFNLMSLEWGAQVFRHFIDEYEASLGADDWPNYVLGNHDKPRLASRIGQNRARMLSFLQLTLRGLPIIYNGDEIGMENGVISTSNARDGQQKRLPGQSFNRDAARAPMAWRDEDGVGFTTETPWLPPAPDHTEHNVEAEERQPDSMLALYRRLIHLRQASHALEQGAYRSIDIQNHDVMAFVREATHDKCYVLLNFSENEQEITIGKIGAWIAGTHVVEGDGSLHQSGTIRLAPYEARLYELRRGEH